MSLTQPTAVASPVSRTIRSRSEADPPAPDLFIAIGGGGFIPARILRSFCKTTQDGKKRNIPIQAVGLTLYESLGGVSIKLGWN